MLHAGHRQRNQHRRRNTRIDRPGYLVETDAIRQAAAHPARSARRACCSRRTLARVPCSTAQREDCREATSSRSGPSVESHPPTRSDSYPVCPVSARVRGQGARVASLLDRVTGAKVRLFLPSRSQQDSPMRRPLFELAPVARSERSPHGRLRRRGHSCAEPHTVPPRTVPKTAFALYRAERGVTVPTRAARVATNRRASRAATCLRAPPRAARPDNGREVIVFTSGLPPTRLRGKPTSWCPPRLGGRPHGETARKPLSGHLSKLGLSEDGKYALAYHSRGSFGAERDRVVDIDKVAAKDAERELSSRAARWS